MEILHKCPFIIVHSLHKNKLCTADVYTHSKNAELF